MAEGYTNRLPLKVDSSDPARAARDVMNWSRTLPFALVGFHFTSVTNQGPIASGFPGVEINFDTEVFNKESFSQAAGVITIPKNKGGMYMLCGGLFWASNVGQVYLSITVNGVAICSQGSSAATDRAFVAGMALLAPDDIVTLHFTNLSGGALTSTHYAGDATTPAVPFLKGTRLALPN